MTACEQSCEIGACVRYMTLVGASARLPYREMNTWLMAEVFQKISGKIGELFNKTLKDKKIGGEDRERLWEVLGNLQETFLDNLKILVEEEKNFRKKRSFSTT